jgi:hypothetical protein
MIDTLGRYLSPAEWAFVLLALAVVIGFSFLTAHVFRRSEPRREPEPEGLKHARADLRKERDRTDY